MIDNKFRFLCQISRDFFFQSKNFLCCFYILRQLFYKNYLNALFLAALTRTPKQFTSPLTCRVYIILSTYKQTHDGLYFNRFCKYQDPIHQKVCQSDSCGGCSMWLHVHSAFLQQDHCKKIQSYCCYFFHIIISLEI